MQENNKGVQIIILAAGKSKRMNSDDPKALAVLRGKPFLAHILDTVASLNLPLKPVIVVGHKKERIFEVLGTSHNYAHQEQQLGTGHAVLSAKGNLNESHKTIVVLSTDQPLVSKETIENLIKNHQDKKAIITIATVKLPDFENWHQGLFHFGRIIRDANNEIEKIVEYKDASEEERELTEVNPAIYAFDSTWLFENIEKIKNENAQQEYYLTDLLHLAHEQGKKIEAVPVANILEGLQPNTKEELEVLERLLV